MTPLSHAGQVATTERGCIVQIQGDGNAVLIGLPHLRLTRYLTRRAIGTGEPDSAGFTPSGEREADLLRSYTEAIPFVGRKRERERLNSWLDSPAPVSVRVLAGPGGRGKTRLVLETCRTRAAAGWRAGFVTGLEMNRFRTQSNLASWGWNAQTLVVLDDAAALTAPLHDWLVELADNDARLNEDGPRLRLLLLERHATPGEGWWAEAFGRGGDNAASVATLLDRPEPETVAALSDPAERRAIFAASFHRAKGAEPDLPADLDARLAELSWGGEPLFLALAGLLAARIGVGAALALPPNALAFEQARRELDRVQAIWLGHGLHQHSTDFATHLAALTTLRGGLPADQAHAVIRAERQAMGFDGVGDPEPIRQALHDALPGPSGGIAPVTPDILGGAMVLERWGRLPAARQNEAVLRAYRDAPDAVAVVFVRLCQDFAIWGHRIAVGWLRAICDSICEEPDHVTTLLTLMPWATVELREIATDLTRTLLRHTHGEGEAARGDRAGLLNELSVRLSDLGQREQALAAIAECVGLTRELAEARPDTFSPNLAVALNNFSNSLSDLGRREAALAAVEECVGLRRKLAEARPDAFKPDLAMALLNFANHLSAMGRLEAALAAAEECVNLYRVLAEVSLDASIPDLATALNNLSNHLAALGRFEAALAAVEECVRLTRKLAEARVDAFTPHLARALHNLSVHLSGLGRREDALAAVEECVGLRRKLAETRPDAFTPDLALSLNNLSLRLSALGHWEAALAAAEECVKLYRALAKARPEAFTPDLASALNNLSNSLSDLGLREKALAAVEECVGLYRELADARPDPFTAELAMALNNLSIHLSGLGRRETGLEAIEECVGLYRELADARPDAFTPDLATALNTLSNRLSNQGRLDAALAAVEECVKLRRVMAKARPDVVTPDLAVALNTLSNSLFALDKREAALAAVENCVGLYRKLAETRPDAFTPDLAKALNNLSLNLYVLDRREAALAAAEECIGLFRVLQEVHRDAFTPDLARALCLLGDCLREAGPCEPALLAYQEGLERLTPAFVATPAAFEGLMDALRQCYLSQCKGLGREPDWRLLGPG